MIKHKCPHYSLASAHTLLKGAIIHCSKHRHGQLETPQPVAIPVILFWSHPGGRIHSNRNTSLCGRVTKKKIGRYVDVLAEPQTPRQRAKLTSLKPQLTRRRGSYGIIIQAWLRTCFPSLLRSHTSYHTFVNYVTKWFFTEVAVVEEALDSSHTACVLCQGLPFQVGFKWVTVVKKSWTGDWLGSVALRHGVDRLV